MAVYMCVWWRGWQLTPPCHPTDRPQTRDGQVWERQVRSPLKKEWYEFDAAQSAEQDSTSKLV